MLGGRTEGGEVLLKKENRCQRIVREMIRRRQVNRTAGGVVGAAERVWLSVVALGVLGPINHGEHGPAIGVAGSLAYGGFHDAADFQVLLRRDAHGRQTIAVAHKLWTVRRQSTRNSRTRGRCAPAAAQQARTGVLWLFGAK